MKTFHLFEVYGVELEYMIVHKGDLKVAPWADRIFHRRSGSWEGEFKNGEISWSNELVSHVIELKTTDPAPDLSKLSRSFQNNVSEINELLAFDNGMLMPSASHPLMNPLLETEIWPHEQHEIYDLYNRIFDCRGHGWSNVQSTHLNLPFCGDVEFDRLHTAIRLVLPALPALCASSPILEGEQTGFHDSRMYHYQNNQKDMPAITGKVVPEYLRSQAVYQQRVFDPINTLLKPYDQNQILDQHFVNSRGAIARFDRGAIEIRVMDIQECPAADLAIIQFVVEVLKALVHEEWVEYKTQSDWHEDELYPILQNAILNGESADMGNTRYPEALGLESGSCSSFQQLWKALYLKVRHRLPAKEQEILEFILNYGSLATRILQAVHLDFSERQLLSVYRSLSDCLARGQMFNPMESGKPM